MIPRSAVEWRGSLGVTLPRSSTGCRSSRTSALFKLYLLNAEDLFFGFYSVIEHTVTIAGEQVPIYDPMGKDAVLFHHVADEDETSTGSQWVNQAQSWFDSVWNTIAREYTP